VLQFEGDRVAAKDAAEAGLKRCPRSEELWNRLGLIHIDERDLSKARKAFEAALQLAPNDEIALGCTAATLRMEGKHAEARQVLDDALRRRPDSLYLLKELFFLLLDQGQFEQARAALARSLAIDPDDEDALVAMINALDGEHPEDAVLFADRALQRLPNSAALRAARGWLAYARNNLARAEEEFKAAIAIDANHPAAVNGMGATHFSQVEYDAAVECFRKVIKLIPADCAGYTNLASALTKQAEKRDGQLSGLPAANNLEEAERLCRTVLSLRDDHAPAWGWLGLIAYKRGQILRAEEFFRRSIRDDA
jgi:protein O-GlcNAc transferase